MDYIYFEDIAEFISVNGLGYSHSPKTIDTRLEDNDLNSIVFYIKECWKGRIEELCEDDVKEVVCDFVNIAADDFGWKYGTFSRYSWHDTFDKIMELCETD